MKKGYLWISVPVVFLSLIPVAVHAELLTAHLDGFNEVPTLSSTATGTFRARLNRDDSEIQYELSYSGFATPVLVSHLHLGRRAVVGGVMVFLCANNGTGPAGTPACPAMEGSVSGTLTAASVVGPAGQGIAPGEWAEVVQAIKEGAAYANVHSQAFPAGEIRDQVDVRDNDHRHHDHD